MKPNTIKNEINEINSIHNEVCIEYNENLKKSTGDTCYECRCRLKVDKLFYDDCMNYYDGDDIDYDSMEYDYDYFNNNDDDENWYNDWKGY